MTSTITVASIKNKDEDVLLVNLIKNGSKRDSDKAFEELFNKYYNPVLFSLSSKMNAIDAEDVAIELFSKLHLKLDMYNEKTAAFNTWLFSASKNAFIDFLRKRKLDTTSISEPTEDGLLAVREIKDTNLLSPEQVIVKQEKNDLLKAIINKALAKKPHLKTLITLRYFEELTYDEISKEINLPLGTVKAQLHRAKKALQQPCERQGLKLK